jgi:hypothetical protein
MRKIGCRPMACRATINTTGKSNSSGGNCLPVISRLPQLGIRIAQIFSPADLHLSLGLVERRGSLVGNRTNLPFFCQLPFAIVRSSFASSTAMSFSIELSFMLADLKRRIQARVRIVLEPATLR